MTAPLQTPETLLEDATDDHPDEIVEQAIELASEWRGHHYGYNPRGCAAAALYAAYRMSNPLASPGDHPKQEDIADEFDTSATTLRKRFRELEGDGDE